MCPGIPEKKKKVNGRYRREEAEMGKRGELLVMGLVALIGGAYIAANGPVEVPIVRLVALFLLLLGFLGTITGLTG